MGIIISTVKNIIWMIHPRQEIEIVRPLISYDDASVIAEGELYYANLFGKRTRPINIKDHAVL